MCFNPLKQSRNKKRDRGRDSQPRARPRLNSQPYGGHQGHPRVLVWRSTTRRVIKKTLYRKHKHFCPYLYDWGQNCFHTVSFRFGEFFWKRLQETLQHEIPGGINSCNVMIGAVLLWQPRIIRLQLQFLSRCRVGMNCYPALYQDFMYSE